MGISFRKRWALFVVPRVKVLIAVLFRSIAIVLFRLGRNEKKDNFQHLRRIDGGTRELAEVFRALRNRRPLNFIGPILRISWSFTTTRHPTFHTFVDTGRIHPCLRPGNSEPVSFARLVRARKTRGWNECLLKNEDLLFP